jgi:hypothetical protein
VNAVPYGSDDGREHCYISLKIIEVGECSEATPRDQSVHHRGWDARTGPVRRCKFLAPPGLSFGLYLIVPAGRTAEIYRSELASFQRA